MNSIKIRFNMTASRFLIALSIIIFAGARPAFSQDPPECPCNLWSSSVIPANPSEADARPIEVGVRFRPNTAGYITGVRFYKGAQNTGTHTGNLWTAEGVNLARSVFTGETATGWQEVSFAVPVPVSAGTVYVASYHTTSGYYPEDNNYFATAYSSYYLEALADTIGRPNGLYILSSATAFPTQGYLASNYWVDVVFVLSVGPDETPPVVSSVAPSDGASGINVTVTPSASFSELINPATATSGTFFMSGPGGVPVGGNVTCSGGILTFAPYSTLSYNTTYTLTLLGGAGGIEDMAGNLLAADYSWSFTTGAPPPPPPTEGPGGPILVISSATNPFSRYTVEILRAEGLNEFFAMDVTEVTPAVMNSYDVIILGEFPVTDQFVTDLTDWVGAGGVLVAFRPDARLCGLLGITSSGGTLTDAYLLVSNTSGPGAGIVGETIQFHSAADLYSLSGATALATLYSDASTATSYPAVTEILVGANGGKAYAFTYDLPRSVVYTRQGNPAWAGQKRDGKIDPIRSDDMFVPPLDLSEPGWIDLNKVAIPQADEQQRLLANIIIRGSMHRKVLPRFWFLPRGLKAAVVMTGDNHGDAGMEPRFQRDITMSPAGCIVEDWECVRSTGYFYVGSTYTNEDAIFYESLGFESALHINTNCANYTTVQYQSFVTSQMSAFATAFPDLPLPVTNRNHCIAWPDWSSTAEVEADNGIRLDANYYYWPNDWHQNRPGMFTGSGSPMRFARPDGTIIDSYQVVTQMQDEGQYSPVTPYPAFCDALLDKAIGPEGYYGVFCANMHFDRPDHPGANAITASAQARGIPVVSARQMLEWLDGRNGSSFDDITWSANTMTFSITAGAGARNLRGMIPVRSGNGELLTITRDGSGLTYTTEIIKGIEYAFFEAVEGDYTATYGLDEIPPVISDLQTVVSSDGSAVISWVTDEPSDSRVDYGTITGMLTLNSMNSSLVTAHSLTLTGLAPLTTYYFRVTSADESSNGASFPVAPAEQTFTTPAAICAGDISSADFSQGNPDANTIVVADGDGAVILRPAFTEDFSGTSLPAGWTELLYTGSASTYSDGLILVDGAHIYSAGTFGPGSSLEFSASFNAGNYQNIGFSVNAQFAAPWAVIGRGTQGDNNLYARATTGGTVTEVMLGSNLLGALHNYRIKWNTDNFEFYVDGSETPAVTLPVTISTTMLIQISDYVASGAILSVDWIRASPYVASGSFTSRVFDGVSQRNWGEVFWNADTPVGASCNIFVRGGDTPLPDGSWTPFIQVPGPGSPAGAVSRFIQYRADLTATNTLYTPVLRDLTITCTEAGESAPVISLNPSSQTVCSGSAVTFTSAATGFPSPSVRWEESSDGVEWTSLDGAVSGTLVFTADQGDDGMQYRAVWTNSEGSAASGIAILEVSPLPSGSLSAVRSTIYTGEDYGLVFNAAAGTGPFSLEINGASYSGVGSGVPFSAGTALFAATSVWNDAFTGGTQTVDATPTELGLAFTASVAGNVTGMRFYKHGTDALPFTVSLWELGIQTPLATAEYTSDNTAGWKQVTFITPVPVSSGTTYIVSYHTDSPYFYAFTSGYPFPRISGPLTALGGYYNNTPGYPGTAYAANYWVDVVFSASISGTTVFNLTAITDNEGCVVTGSPVSSATITVDVARVWTGNTDSDWNNPGNWSEGIVPGAENIVIPVGPGNYPALAGSVTVDDLVIGASAMMSVTPTGALTVTGNLVVDGELTIGSTLSASGSLIVNGVSSGNIRYNLQLKPGSQADSDWHLAALPVVSNSEANSWKVSTAYRWSEPAGTWIAIPLTSVSPGQGINIRQEETSDGLITFTGPVAGGDIVAEASSPWADAVGANSDYFARAVAPGRSLESQGGRGWNLLGNPYSSAINAEAFINANYSLTPSLSQFDPNYVALYLFNGTDRRYYYLANSTGWPSGSDLGGTHIQAGQGFFVLAMNDNSAFTFTRAMQEHSTGTAMLKSGGSTSERWPGVQLKVKHASGEAVTTVVYGSSMTPDVDPGYDVGLFRSGQDIELYTALAAKDNGIYYTRQALPVTGADTLVTAVGIDLKNGGEVTFTAETIPVERRRFWLEDAVTGTYTDLGLKSYTVNLPAGTNGTGRFFIIASANMPTAIGDPGSYPGDLRIWTSECRLVIRGRVGAGSLCEIFDMSGRKMAEQLLSDGEMNFVDLPVGMSGVIVVRVTDGNYAVTRKLALPGGNGH